jgi:hypothetical protein
MEYNSAPKQFVQPLYLRRAAHPKTSKPTNTKMTISTTPVPDKLGLTSASGVALTLGSVVVNFWVDVGVTGVCVIVEVMLG